MTAYLFLVIASYVMLKAVRDGLYLDAFGAVKLPYVIIGIAVLVGLFVDIYIRISRHVRVPMLIALTLGGCIACLLTFWSLGRSGRTWLYPVLYIWVGCFGVIAPVQVWTLINEVFATRQVKRLVGFIGAGGILGGAIGGTLVGTLAARVGTINLLLVVVVLLLVCTALVTALAPHRRTETGSEAAARPRNLRDAARRIGTSRHLMVIGGLVWISALSTTIVDFQFKSIASSSGFTRDELTAFFGTAYGLMSLGCLATQLLAVRFLLRRAGLGLVILVLPFSLIGGTAVLLAVGGLVAATLAKAGDGVFKHSVDRSSKEMAYLPVPRSIKVSVKSAIDMVLDRLGDGTGGVLLLVLATWLGWGARPIAAVNLVLLGVWLAIAIELRRSYVTELERSIAGSGRLSASDEALDDADARAALGRALRSDNDREVLAALDLVALNPGGGLEDELRRLARDGSAEVRARVFGVLATPGGAGFPEELTAQLEQEDQQLLVMALDLVLAPGAQEVQEKAEELIGGVAPETRGAMLALLVRRLGPEFEPLAERMLASLVEPTAPADVRRAAATALGLLPPDSPLIRPLGPLLADPDAGVRRQAAESAGLLERGDLAAELVDLLGDPRTRRAARTALLYVPGPAADALLDAVLSGTSPEKIQRRVPRILAHTVHESHIDRLAAALDSDNGSTRQSALETLAWRRRSLPETPLPAPARAAAAAGVAGELAACGALLDAWEDLVSIADGRDLGTLRTVLKERVSRGVDRMFLWLELGHSPVRLRGIRASLGSGDRSRRENAIELLEGMLADGIRVRVVSILDRLPSDDRMIVARRRKGNPERALRLLAGGADEWMAAWAVNIARRRDLRIVIESVKAPTTTGDGALSEELRRANQDPTKFEEDHRMAATLVDKVMALKSVDLFSTVPAEDLVHVARVAHERNFVAGESLFEEGDRPGPLYLVLEGRVGLRRGPMAAGEIPAGSPVGTLSLFDDQPRSHTAFALEDVRALVVEREDFYDVLAENVEVLRSLVGNLLHRLQGLAV